MDKPIKIAVITESQSSLYTLLQKSDNISAFVISPKADKDIHLDGFDAFCVLGGDKSTPIVLSSPLRVKLEEQIAKGKRVFYEYCASILDTYADRKTVQAYTRILYLGEGYKELKTGDILDDRNNHALSFHFKYAETYPIMVYRDYIMAHSHLQDLGDTEDKVTNYALFMLRQNVMVCAFRLSSFVTARFVPAYRWRLVAESILVWLCGVKPSPLVFPTVYNLSDSDLPFPDKIHKAVNKAIGWYSDSSLMVNGGKDGIKEGLSHISDGNGVTEIAEDLRADCCGESALAFYSHHKLTGNPASLQIFHNLMSFVFDSLQVHGGVFDGMVRWSNRAWTVCYQDDVARAIIPAALYTIYDKDDRYKQNILRAIDFMARTTHEDGLRPSRTDLLITDGKPEGEALELLKNQSPTIKCAHYNAYYHALLLMGYKLSGNKDYLTLGVNGLETIMSVYPDTVREQSETEELCRLILPLAWLYHTTGKDTHKEMLYRVTKDLQRLKTPDGAYLEWDTGYTAHCSKTSGTESSLLADNGDTVCDFLYSMNWLPLGYSQAYMITGDEYFKTLWQETAEFFADCQIESSLKLLHGCWARAFDPVMRDYYGMPHDIGWGPWAIETGWTVGEITAGLGLGLVADELIEFYR